MGEDALHFRCERDFESALSGRSLVYRSDTFGYVGRYEYVLYRG